MSARRISIALAALSLSGCAFFHDPALEERYRFTESPLGPLDLEARFVDVERYYAEPRDVERVRRSLELAEASISSRDGYQGLWRAARACYWLAAHHPEPEARRSAALRGAQIGAAASRLAASDPASHYFHALNLGILSEIEGRGLRRVSVMAELVQRVIALDERFEHAGGHRFFGILCDKTKDNPLVAFGDVDDALRHLRRACELFPDYGGNQLALAEALLGDGEVDEARQRLEKVLASAAPEDEAEAHAAWSARARALLVELGGA
jgi:tetratricopeptide (TPR) repeat protein